jgi:hypothetical protein
MILEVPSIQTPDVLTQICKLELFNTRACYTEISNLIQEDQFLSLYVQDAFSKYLKKGGVLGMLTALGWDGFRNRLAEAYIYHARYNKYPLDIELDEVNDVIDIEKRFDFLFVESNGRSFLFGLYLKLTDIALEKRGESGGHELISIPLDVDEVLIKGTSKTDTPDWLILMVWNLVKQIGQQDTFNLLKSTGGDIDKIFNKLTTEQYEDFMYSVLRYGQGINDEDFFLGKRV